MRDWNVVVTVNEGGFVQAIRFLGQLGEIAKTDFYNVLVMKSDDITGLLDEIARQTSEEPAISSFLSRIAPLTHMFHFQSPEEFEGKAREIVLNWAAVLAGKGFHVRMHRRGFKGRISSQQAEQFLDETLLEALDKANTPAHVTFDDPDFIIAVETLGPRAGISLWARKDLVRYPFLRLD
jgi:tRNA(Ser,Leu) C12 N-acetylase TAN1